MLLEAVAKLRTGREVELVVVGRPKPDGPVARAVEDLGITDCVRFVSGLPDAGSPTCWAPPRSPSCRPSTRVSRFRP